MQERVKVLGAQWRSNTGRESEGSNSVVSCALRARSPVQFRGIIEKAVFFTKGATVHKTKHFLRYSDLSFVVPLRKQSNIHLTVLKLPRDIQATLSLLKKSYFNMEHLSCA